MSFQVMPSVLTPNAARAYAHPVAAPAVVADIQGRAESIRRDPAASSPPQLSSNATAPKVSFFA
ncbi:MAG: hypothetical protein GC202_10205 [Alphaproteobacteria bacterium]|nr:hypothetical protein [Alphaproteobacteria bacterium]